MNTNTPPQTPTNPQKWYKNYMITVFVIGLPAFVVIVCIFFIVFAVKIKDATVRDDWYMDGKSLYQDVSKDQLAHDLGLGGVLRFDDKQVLFELSHAQTVSYPKTLHVKISHATDKSKDRDFTLTQTQDNLYQGTVELDSLPSKYYLHINSDDGWRLIQTQKLPAKNVSFTPLSAFDESKQTLPDQRDKRHKEQVE